MMLMLSHENRLYLHLLTKSSPFRNTCPYN
nr:MAG TPA: hypothetical protein [Caudoviricetes sp.]DAQ57203.1 MAG TPA: hypothetical protein [Caudoviricetes sp.]